MFNSFPLITGKMDSTNCSVPNVWMFIANEETRGLFLESPGKLLSAFNNFSNIKTKLSVNEAKLTELCYYSTGFGFKIGLRPEKFPGLSRKGP